MISASALAPLPKPQKFDKLTTSKSLYFITSPTCKIMSLPSRSLLDLPAELKLQIFLHLSATEVTRLRRVCQPLHAFVNDNSNRISNQIKSRELKRLRDFISYYVTYEGEVSFLEAFSRWARIRGWASNTTNMGGNANSSSIFTFSRHLTSIKKYPDLSMETQNIAYNFAKNLWRSYMELHNVEGYARGLRPMNINMQKFVRLMSERRACFEGLTTAELESMYHELESTSRGRLSGPHREVQELPGGAIAFRSPSYASSIMPKDLVRNFDPVSYSRWIPHDEREMLGVPKLPWTNSFTYVVSSDWARYLVQEIKVLSQEEITVNPLMIAAALEELQIH